MQKTVIGIEGMMCGMCESHVNDAIRKVCEVKRVESSHDKKQTIIISEGILDEDAVKKAITDLGYKVTSYNNEPYEKKTFFSFFKKK